MKKLTLALLIAFAAVFLYGIALLPDRADPAAAPQRETSAVGSPSAASYYIEHAYEDAETPNIVTVILADYRGYDTLGETSVIFTAGIACFLILRRRRRRGEAA